MEEAGSGKILTFLTDFGLDWGPVGVCRAVMAEIAPGVPIIDLSHGIPPFNIAAGAWVLAASLPFVPVGVHVAVVDPGVGTERLPLAIRTVRGDVLIGPDNGLLIPAAIRLGGIGTARKIANPEVMRHPVSHTFHGRDIFSPSGAHLASGFDFDALGDVILPADLVPAPWREPAYTEKVAQGEVVLLDNFGNARTNLETSKWPLNSGEQVLMDKGSGPSLELTAAKTFGDIKPGEGFVYNDSSDYICIGVNLDNAGRQLGLKPGQSLTIRRS